MLADEPTGALDRETADDVYDLLAQAVTATGAALRLVSHDVGAARIADRVVRIRDGRVSEQWHPGQTDETLVVDKRGWVRLPEPMRRATGARAGVVASVQDRTIQLVGTAAEPGTSQSAALADGAAGRDAGCGSDAASTTLAARAEGVHVSRAGRTVLNGFGIAVPVAALTAVQGRSGSGKSTALRCLAGLDRPDSGLIEVGGRDLAGLNRDAVADLRRAGVAYLGQAMHLAEGLDVVETVQVARAVRGLPCDDAQVDEWLASLDLDGLRGRPVAAALRWRASTGRHGPRARGGGRPRAG